MRTKNKIEAIILLVGDLLLFVFSLWIALIFRYGQFPSGDLWYSHIIPFSIIFIISVMVFFAAGLYEKHTLILRSKLPSKILNAQIINAFIAVLIFYLIPYFNIAPRTNLFIYLVISFVLITLWRLYGLNILAVPKKHKAIIVGAGEEMGELFIEVNQNLRYDLEFISSINLEKIEGIDFKEEIAGRVYSENVEVIVVDIQNEKIEPILPHLYNLLFSDVRFLDMHKVYEEIFDRIPLSLVKYNWFLENISSASRRFHDTIKRFMDIALSFVFGGLSLLLYPFIISAIFIEGGRPIFIDQKRVGQNNREIHLWKFRTMTGSDSGESVLKSDLKVTKTGSFLRAARIDEFPQFWNVLKGDISLIGPRPEFPAMVKKYEENVPYYNIRHLIKPGLSGWAQLYHDNHPHHGLNVDETRQKLSYDLYYLKNRSFILDIKIALKTVGVILSRKGK